MILGEHDLIRIDTLEQIEDKLNEDQLNLIRKADQKSALNVNIPKKYESNKEKAIYKIGFLYKFLKYLYPDATYREIVQIMNDRYQIFIGQRQVERNVKEYLDNDIYR